MQTPSVASDPTQRCARLDEGLRLALRVALAVVLGVFAPACADDSRPARPDSPGQPARPPGPPIAESSDGPAVPEAPTIDVAGHVVDDLEREVVGRPIVVVDRRGRRFDVMTDEGGSFHAMGVASPYDLLVEAAPSGAVLTPLVYLGLRRADPRIEVFERSEPTARAPSQRIRVGVKLPTCRPPTACWLIVVTASTTGGGSTVSSYGQGAGSARYDVDHAWPEGGAHHGEPIDVHVLVGDAAFSEYSYSRVLEVAQRPGERLDVGLTAPLHVDSTDPIMVAGSGRALPDGWHWTLASQLEFPGGASFALRNEWAAASTMRLPRLPGATWRVRASAQRPTTEGPPFVHLASEAWSGTLPLTAMNVALDVPRVADAVRPTIEGRMSGRGLGFAWDAAAPGLASIVLVDLARGQQRFRLFTAEAEIALKRLESLGLPRLATGDHVIERRTTPGATVDELTQPDPERRRRRFDVHVPGGATHQRFRFTVTP